MADYIKDLHAATFTDPTSCRIIHLILNSIRKKYNKHFNNIIIFYQCCDGTRRIIPQVGSGIKKIFGLLNQPKDKIYQLVDIFSSS